MKELSAEHYRWNQDRENGALRSLVGFTIWLLVAGMITLIIGVVNDYALPIIFGSLSVGLGIQGLIGVALFWAWRFERRMRPVRADVAELTP